MGRSVEEAWPGLVTLILLALPSFQLIYEEERLHVGQILFSFR